MAGSEGLSLTEGQIRGLLNNAEALGFVEMKQGRKGTVLTDKGYGVIASIKNNGIITD